jgi:hypothetical protein
MQSSGRRRRHLIQVLVLLASLVGCLASGPVVAQAEPPPVAAYNGASEQIDVPYVFRGGGQTATLDQATGLVGWEQRVRDPLEDLEQGPVYMDECIAVGGCGSGMGRCGFTFTEWPPHTLTPQPCFSFSIDTSDPSGPGVLEVAVPLTTEASANTLVFDHWTLTGGAPATAPPRCRVGDMGAATLSWEHGVESNVFATGASYRAWSDPPAGVGSGTFEAHYADQIPDTTAPMINVESPFDCQWVKGGSTVNAVFSCDDMGGSGVASCLTSGDISDATLDTSSEGEKSFTVTAVDNVGNTRTRTIRYFVDGKPPTLAITANPSAPTGSNGWYNVAQLGTGAFLPYTVSASDSGAGMYFTWCSFDGAPEERVAGNQITNEDPYVFPPEQYAATPISTQSPVSDGVHTVACHAQDRLQQDTGSVTKTFKVDTTPPAPASFTNEFFGGKTWCHGTTGPATFPAFRQRTVAWSSAGGVSGLVGASSGLLDLDTTPTANAGELRSVQAPTVESQAGNVTSGEICEYRVGPPEVTSASSAVSCPPGRVAVLAPISCEVTIRDEDTEAPLSPTGSVAATSSGKGSIAGPCSLAGTGGTATCAFQYTPSTIGSGTRQLTIAYPGDTSHLSSSAVGQIKVTRRATSTALSCEKTTVAVTQPDTCTVTVTDTSPGLQSAPSGTVIFIASPSNSSFTPTSCTLAPTGSGPSASCQTIFRATAGPRRPRTIEARYRQDPTHARSHSAILLAIG